MSLIGQPTTYNKFEQEQRRTVVINQAMSASSSFNVDISSAVGFTPKYMIIRQICYANVAGTDSGTYLLWTNLNGGFNVAAFYVGIQGVMSNPQNIITMGSPTQNIQFNLQPANTAFVNPTGQLTMVLEFVSNKTNQAISV